MKTFQHSLRNQVCGLCGDLNDEKTADMKSAGMCIMSSPKLAAYSYMVPGNKCAGIPPAHLAQFQAETARCVRKELIPTKVTEVFNQKTVISMKHLVEESINKVCISKMQINICGASTVPKEVVMKEVITIISKHHLINVSTGPILLCPKRHHWSCYDEDC